MSTRSLRKQSIVEKLDSSNVLFWAVHLSCIGVFWTGLTMTAVVLCVSLYLVRMFAITAGYHRYFSHRTYKMGRVMQFIMAWVAMTSAQKGVIWWAANHRHHHLHSDHEEDIHSPVLQGFWHSHVGWLLSKEHAGTKSELVKDLMKYPEIRWIDRFHLLPVVTTAILCLVIGGLPGLIVGFSISTVLTWHATFTINSLCHVFGQQRYKTGDASKNNLFLALLTLGEGWHNNHHHYQSSTNQGFFWWEIDITYYVLVLMSKVGLVWDLRRPPKHVIEGKCNPRKSKLLKQVQQTSAISVVGNSIQGTGTKR